MWACRAVRLAERAPTEGGGFLWGGLFFYRFILRSTLVVWNRAFRPLLRDYGIDWPRSFFCAVAKGQRYREVPSSLPTVHLATRTLRKKGYLCAPLNSDSNNTVASAVACPLSPLSVHLPHRVAEILCRPSLAGELEASTRTQQADREGRSKGIFAESQHRAWNGVTSLHRWIW